MSELNNDKAFEDIVARTGSLEIPQSVSLSLSIARLNVAFDKYARALLLGIDENGRPSPAHFNVDDILTGLLGSNEEKEALNNKMFSDLEKKIALDVRKEQLAFENGVVVTGHGVCMIKDKTLTNGISKTHIAKEGAVISGASARFKVGPVTPFEAYRPYDDLRHPIDTSKLGDAIEKPGLWLEVQDALFQHKAGNALSIESIFIPTSYPTFSVSTLL